MIISTSYNSAAHSYYAKKYKTDLIAYGGIIGIGIEKFKFKTGGFYCGVSYKYYPSLRLSKSDLNEVAAHPILENNKFSSSHLSIDLIIYVPDLFKMIDAFLKAISQMNEHMYN